MKPRGILLLAMGVVVGALALLTLTGHMLSPGRPCPAVGYAYTGDVELTFSRPPGSAAACFGESCIPQEVAGNAGGKWLVPQSPPYLKPPVSVTSIYVEATDLSGHRLSRYLPIETESTGEHPFGPGCGGPFRFKPVYVAFD